MNNSQKMIKRIMENADSVKVCGFSGIHFYGNYSIFEYDLTKGVSMGITPIWQMKNIVLRAFARPYVYEGKERAIERLRETNLPSWAVDIVEDDVHGVENKINRFAGRTPEVIDHFKWYLKDMSRILGYDVRLIMTAHHSPSWAILFQEYYVSSKSALRLKREDLVVKFDSGKEEDIIEYANGDVREQIRLFKTYVGPNDKAWPWKLQMIFQGEVMNSIEELASPNQTWNDMHFHNNSCIGGSGPDHYLVNNKNQWIWISKYPNIGTGFHDWGDL